MDDREYLLTYGKVGDFGRFQSAESLHCRRGDRLVVRTHRGQEMGVVVRSATQEHGRLLADHFVGEILRRATEGDRELAERMQKRSQRLFEDARRLAGELHLPVEILDAEILLDARQAVIHHLRWAESDLRLLMDPLCKDYRLLVSLHNLALPATAKVTEEHEGCGTAGCGKGGGCGSCQSGHCATCVSSRKATAAKAARPEMAHPLNSDCGSAGEPHLLVASAAAAIGTEELSRISLL